MKAFNIKNGIQYSCDLEGESWRQGSTIKGVFEVNDSTVERNIFLVTGSKKKIKEKDPKAYSIIELMKLSNDDQNKSFELKLSKDCPIADTYLLFGSGEDLFEYGNLVLSIREHEVIEGYLEVLNLFYKFKPKKLKTNKANFVETKIDVPTSEEYKNVVSLKLLLKMVEDIINVSFDFVINKVDFGDGDAKLVKEKLLVETSLTEEEYLIYGSSINQDAIKKSIDGVVEQVKKKQFKI